MVRRCGGPECGGAVSRVPCAVRQVEKSESGPRIVPGPRLYSQKMNFTLMRACVPGLNRSSIPYRGSTDLAAPSALAASSAL